MERFKEINRRYQRRLSGRFRELGALGAPLDAMEQWVAEYQRRMDEVVAMFDDMERHLLGVDVDVCDEVTRIVQNELFPFALTYWTLLYCEKVKTQ